MILDRSGGRRRGQKGHVLILALFVLVLTMTVGAALALSLQFRMERLRRETATVQLTALLDGAVSHALAELRVNPAWRGTGAEQPLGDGIYTIRTELDGVQSIRVEVTAIWGREGRAATAVYDRYLERITSWEPRPYTLDDPFD